MDSCYNFHPSVNSEHIMVCDDLECNDGISKLLYVHIFFGEGSDSLFNLNYKIYLYNIPFNKSYKHT